MEEVIVSHADSDHYNGLPDLLDRFDVGRVGVPEGFGGADEPGPAAVLDAVRARGVPVATADAGDRDRPGRGAVGRASCTRPGAGSPTRPTTTGASCSTWRSAAGTCC